MAPAESSNMLVPMTVAQRGSSGPKPALRNPTARTRMATALLRMASISCRKCANPIRMRLKQKLSPPAAR